jgi:hypothetical protein
MWRDFALVKPRGNGRGWLKRQSLIKEGIRQHRCWLIRVQPEGGGACRHTPIRASSHPDWTLCRFHPMRRTAAIDQRTKAAETKNF